VPGVKRDIGGGTRAGLGLGSLGMDEPMNRPAVREFVAPGTQVPPGELLIPTEVGDPVRGPVPCPAAPLVGGSLLRRAKQVGYAPVVHCVDPSDDEGGAVVFDATCPLVARVHAEVGAHPALAERVTGALSGLGPLSVTSRRVSTDIVGVPTA
jgi:hypothetical protein